MDWVINNREWVFSGLGVVILGGVVKIFKHLFKKGKEGNVIENHIDININPEDKNTPSDELKKNISENKRSLEEYKNITKILFIDDNVRFKVVKILSRSGWIHAKLIKDCDALDDPDVEKADILFIDVQGVGVALGFADEGLGLALAIKEKYKHKKVIIYSAETEGNRFHEALRKADSFLAKNADPYQFQKIVEEYTIGI